MPGSLFTVRHKVRFALVGAGAIARSYWQVLATSETAELVAVADVNLDAAIALAGIAGCRVFDSHTSLIRWGGAEAVVVCTPPALHAPIALDCVHAGLAVLCEKPLAIDVASARRMLHAAQTAGVLLTMASKFRYVEDIVQAKAFIEGGALGEPIALENAFASSVAMAGRWHADPACSGGGVIIDNGTHSVDVVRYLCGPITAIAAYEGPRRQELPVEDTAHLIARTSRGVLASIDLSWSCQPAGDTYIHIHGTAGAVALGWRRSRYRRSPDQGWVSFGSGYDKLAALGAEIDNFARTLRGEEQILITPADALASVEVISAAYRSLACDGWVRVSEAEAPAVAAVTPVVAAG
jgi:predicted dehydrogenase